MQKVLRQARGSQHLLRSQRNKMVDLGPNFNETITPDY